MEKSRLEIFEETTKNCPTDSFAHYALALEYEKAGRLEESIATYKKLIGFDPEYLPAFQMWGQLLIRLSRSPEAQEVLRRGLDVARRAGNAKAANEIQGLISDLGG
jgi:tetratricopeptide (TPR) repeat protein